jgi:hypothetical protein
MAFFGCSVGTKTALNLKPIIKPIQPGEFDGKDRRRRDEDGERQ